jgi:tRNA (guanine-N7-)-methyltransferase
MSKGKLEKFAMISDYKNVVEPSMDEAMNTGIALKGNWNKTFFNNNNPIVVELACGGGEYTIGLAAMHPNKNFIGVDIKGNRIWKGATKAIEQNLDNVGFLRTRIDFIANCFAKNEVDEIWITFPDPQMKKNRRRKRLTNKLFLSRYQKFLKANGKMRLKSDSTFFYAFTKEIIEEKGLDVIFECDDIYTKYTLQNPNTPLSKELELKTFYENMWLEKGKTIKYIEYTLDKFSITLGEKLF